MTAETPQAQPLDPPAQDAGPGASPTAMPAEAAPQAPAPPAEASTSEAAPSAGAEGSSDSPAEAAAPAEGGEGEGGEGAEGESQKPRPRVIETRPDGAPKKRRRRKRKGGAPGQATPHAEGEGAAGEGTEAAGEDTEGGEPAQAHEGQAPRRDHAKPKGPRPPRPDRERPAFTVGDIVFGKVTEITDEAIFIDLSGKGRGIFDRAELLLPLEEEEEHAKEPDDEAEAPPAEASSTEAPSTDPTPAQDAPQAEAQPAEAPPAAEAQPEAAPAAPEPVAAIEAPPVEAAATAPEPAAEGETGSPEAEPPRPEPKPHRDPQVPRVILEVGAPFVGMVHNDGGRGGLVVLTHHPKRVSKAKVASAAAFKDKTLVQGIVTGVIKGGVEVDVDGLRAFAPGSHMDLRLGADLSPLVGKRLPFYVTQYAKRGRDVVLSRKAMLEVEARAAREAALKRLQVGAVVEGTVRSVVPFGAFIDIGDIEGLVPLAEMSHNRADGPSDVFKAGEKVPVKIIKLDDKGKVWLSRKATIPDPWGEVAKKYAVGTKHAGKVVRLQPFGAFVELEPGIDGLIHTADLSTKRIEHPSELVKVDDPIEVVVAHLDPGAHRIGLHPALSGDAAEEAPQRVQQYKMVKAKVVAIDPGGLVVRILGVTGRNGRAFITSAATGTPRGTDLRKHFPIGQVVEAKVMEIDPKRGEVKLSIKSLNEQHERDAYQQYRQQLNREARFTFGDLLKKNQQQK